MMRRAALTAVLIGAVGSLALMLRVGRHNPSVLLMAMFTLWVVAPFVALGWAHRRSARWPDLTRQAMQVVTFVVALGSLAIYGQVAFGPPRPTPAAAFLLVPAGSWLLVAIAAVVGAVVARLRSRA